MIPKPLDMAKQFISSVIREGEVVVDATLGNGHDALFLAEKVGANGMVIGFDVQAAAISSATIRLEDAGHSHFKFYEQGHETIQDIVDEGAAAIMFNLGYLPRADKSVITTEATTLVALEQSIQIVRKGGVVTVMCYPGHAGGDVEAESVKAWSSALSREAYRVVHYGYTNAPNSPAFLIAIVKI